MESIFYSNLVRTLGWTFIHSLWQGLLAVVILLTILKIFKPQTANVRYWLTTLVLLAFVGASTITFMVLNQSFYSPNLSGTLLFDPNGFDVSQLSTFSLAETNWQLPSDIIPYLMMAWSVGALYYMLSFIYGIWHIKRLRTTAVNSVSQRWLDLLRSTRQNMGIDKLISWLESPHVSSPLVIGHLKPVILFPIGLISGLDARQIEAIIVHELSHIKRHDFIVNMAQSFVEVVFYFNPFVWFISNKIRIERENTCDDQALSMGIPPHLYANTLADIYEHQLRVPGLSMAFSSRKNHTLKRIQRLMKTQSKNNNKSLIGVLMGSALLILVYFGQIYPGTSAAQQGNLSMVSDAFFETPAQVVIAEPVVEPVPVEAVARVTPPVEALAVVKEVVAVADTIDVEDLKLRKKELDQVMIELKATEQWQKMEELSLELEEMNIKLIEDIEPVMNEQMVDAMKAIKLQEHAIQEMAEMAEQMVKEFDFDMDVDVDVNEMADQLKEVMIVQEYELQEQMQVLKESLHDIDLERIHERAELAQMALKEAQINAEEFQKMANQAQVMAEKARNYAAEIKSYYARLTNMLIDDGYVKSENDIDQIEVEDGVFLLNGEKLKKKDQKKYMDLHNSYFDGDDFKMNGNG